ncbi:hydantoinase/oxoprolinase family protein [Ruminococcaceae bacterium OttesenSCG-928-I18]|nr:hydantoinase/oxoprolinase family protein [Ruminococcaceae bacterium OttesenSCG-928-I18]
MSLVLGIDTGGTNTDAVIIDRQKRSLLAKAKALTTREDLSLGISHCLEQMDGFSYGDIEFIALSTTLATNAIVEGRGCEVGLLMLGYEPSSCLPVREMCLLPGGHNIHGQERQAFDEQAVRAELLAMQGKVDAIAISSYLSIRNPEHELRASELATEVLGLPSVCAHQLTRSLGMEERTVTAVLNARLIPIISRLIASVKQALKERNLEVPIMIVKGDGSLMGEEQARNKPIETILSGPAASIIGAGFLTGEKDAIVFDMGGTTSDVAVLKDGVPRINQEGARVGGWLTRVEAADIYTYGLGGDSYLQMDMNGVLQIGPQRVWPISLFCSRYPHLLEELSSITIPRSILLLFAQVVDCFVLLNKDESVLLDEKEAQVIELLGEAPHSIFYLAQKLGNQVYTLNLDRLVNAGLIGRIALTPTDILHVSGKYTQWDRKGAQLASALLADRFGIDVETLCLMVEAKMVEKLSLAVWQSLVLHEGRDFVLEENELFTYLCAKQLQSEEETSLHFSLRPALPVIGIGAPVSAWLPQMAEKLCTRLVIPEHTEVANAVGAAAGRVTEIVKILISPGAHTNGFVLHSRWERKPFERLEQAVAYGMQEAEKRARQLVLESGAKRAQVTIKHKDIYAKTEQGENDVYIESRIEAIGSEESEWTV